MSAHPFKIPSRISWAIQSGRLKCRRQVLGCHVSTAARGKKTQKESTSSLEQIIEDTIVATGPISVARYMQLCLSHPTLGYYSQGDVFGRKGDFITSPEISQIFGELVAVWLLTQWVAAGSPSTCRIVELGPGRGTLMDDILRTFNTLKLSSNAIKSVHLVENSLKMREIQRMKLSSRAERMGTQVYWYNDIESVPAEKTFTLVVAHEFFDAMPIHVIQRTDNGFREVKVSRNPSYLPSTGNARFCLAIDRDVTSLSSVLPASSSRYASLPVGSQFEISPDSYRISRRVGTIMRAGGGAGLFIDYGGDRSFSSSFRAFRNHHIVDIFNEPGSSDLTANVDFAYLKESLNGVAATFGPISQSKFLFSLGLEPRLSKLVAAASTTQTGTRLRQGANRLTDPLGMGTQYQVLGIISNPTLEKNTGNVYPFTEKKGTGLR